MKRFLTIIFAIAFSGVALSAQNNADTLVIVVKERQSIDQQAKKNRRPFSRRFFNRAQRYVTVAKDRIGEPPK